MDHSYFKDRLSAYRDGVISESERTNLEDHIKECEECRQLLAGFEKLDRLIEKHSRLGGDEYWEQSALRIERRLEAGESTVTNIRPAGRTAPSGWKWLATAASFVILTFIGLHQTDILTFQEPEIQTPGVQESTDSVIAQESAHQVSPFPEEKPQDSEALSPSKKQAVDDHITSPIPDTASPDDEPQSTRGRDYRAPDLTESAPAGTEEVEISVQESEQVDAEMPSPVTSEKVTKPEAIPKGAGVPSEEETGTPDGEQADQNYRALSRRSAKAMMAQPSPGTGQSETITSDSLQYWRRKKDSLFTLILSSGKIRLDVAAHADKAAEDTPSVYNDISAKDHLESELLEACFQLARLSSDSSEVRRATEYIEGVAEDSTSRIRDVARSYLADLKK